MIENSIKTQFLGKTENDKTMIKKTFLSATQKAFNEAIEVK